MFEIFNLLILSHLFTAYSYIYTFYRLFKRDKACRILSKWFISKIEKSHHTYNEYGYRYYGY
ncbi:hypothetical protein SC65A3_00363 [Psychrobacter sp. SC65A.3]|nr:hypothetical protein SC65A3_00363 [Psychrobacter sp. SC65A.3]